MNLVSLRLVKNTERYQHEIKIPFFGGRLRLDSAGWLFCCCFNENKKGVKI
jgi:hypothetical protein